LPDCRPEIAPADNVGRWALAWAPEPPPEPAEPPPVLDDPEPPLPGGADLHGFQPETVKESEAWTVRSPFWETNVAVALPESVWQVSANAPCGPPLSTTRRSVWGMSGSPENVVDPAARLTRPISVSENGCGNTSASCSPLESPVRYALPDSGFGYTGDVAVAEPTGVQLLHTLLVHSADATSRLGATTLGGKVSCVEPVVSSFGACLTSAVSVSCRSFASLTAVTDNVGG
jgi:hypothetical protein